MSSNCARLNTALRFASTTTSTSVNSSQRKPNLFLQTSNSIECSSTEVGLPDALYNCRDPNERSKSHQPNRRSSHSGAQTHSSRRSISLVENSETNPIAIDDSDDQSSSIASTREQQDIAIDSDEEPSDTFDMEYIPIESSKSSRKQSSRPSSRSGSTSSRGRGKTGKKRGTLNQRSIEPLSAVDFYDGDNRIPTHFTLFDDSYEFA